MEIEGIIKISGAVKYVTHSSDHRRWLHIALEYNHIYEKSPDAPEYTLVEEPLGKKYVNLYYYGPVELDENMVQSLCFPEDVKKNALGYGNHLYEINPGNRITVYILWRSNKYSEDKYEPEKVIVITHSAQPENVNHLIERIAAKTHAQQ